MKQSIVLTLGLACGTFLNVNAHVPAEKGAALSVSQQIPLDSIQLSDPCILADKATHTYYMTGTGGMMWTSKDLKYWEGPKKVAEIDPQSWMGSKPAIWAAELHQYQGKYYYFATFTNPAVIIDEVKGNKIERRACQVLVSDQAAGPYRPFGDATYLPANQPTLDGTFWIDKDGKPYMVYCGEWLQNWNGTIEKIKLKVVPSARARSCSVLLTVLGVRRKMKRARLFPTR